MMKFVLSLIIIIVVLIFYFFGAKTSKDILVDRSFYYMESCVENKYSKDTFTKKEFKEEGYLNERVVEVYETPVDFNEKLIAMSDGNNSFFCKVEEDKKGVDLICVYGEEVRENRLWKSLKIAQENNPYCE